MQAGSWTQEQRRRLDLSDHLCSHDQSGCTVSSPQVNTDSITAASDRSEASAAMELQTLSDPGGKFQKQTPARRKIPLLQLYIVTRERSHALAPSWDQVLICGPNSTQLQACGRINLPAV